MTENTGKPSENNWQRDGLRIYEKRSKPLPGYPADKGTPAFDAIWECIKTWDINVPEAYGGYCGATGSHVQAILNALKEKNLLSS